MTSQTKVGFPVSDCLSLPNAIFFQLPVSFCLFPFFCLIFCNDMVGRELGSELS